MVAVPAEILDAVQSDDDAAFNALILNEHCCFAVDWREEDEWIVRYCESVLQTGRLSAESVGVELFIVFGPRRVRVPLEESAADRHITLLSLNEALAPEFEVRLLYASVGSDTGTFVPLGSDVWSALEREASEVVSRRFHKLTPYPNTFTDLVRVPTKPTHRAWWRFWKRG